MSVKLPVLSPATAEALVQNAVMSRRDCWAVLKASGTGVRDYLQGQITQDIHRLSETQGIHACMLTPQGKAVCECYLLAGHDEEIILLVPANRAEQAVARLRRFALGYTLRIGVVASMAICSIQGTHAADMLAGFDLNEPDEAWLAASRHASRDLHACVMPADPRGFWIVGDRQELRQRIDASEAMIPESEIEAMRIIRGLPRFGVEWDEKLHPLNANLIEFDGVSFDKGCYVGQEVTSRMHWRGGIKKKLYRVEIDAVSLEMLPCPLHLSGRAPATGELRSAALDHEGCMRGIAWLPIETAESGQVLALGSGETVRLLGPCHA